MAMDLLMIEPEDFIANQSNEHFAQYFWGDKNLGFQVLYQNVKHGQTSIKELQDYIRESAAVEEFYAKQMMKLAKSAANCSQQGTFYPLMDIFRVMNEKVSSCHMDIVLKLQDIIKDLQKYHDEQKSLFKKHKDTFSGTSESLHQLQAATSVVNKTKEKFYQISSEEEKLRASAVTQKDQDRLAAKLKKASDDYKGNVGKHAIARHQFEEKMYQAANEFQRLEKEHLDRMKSFLDTYILSFENSHVLVSQVHQEFRRQLEENTSDSILCQYAKDRGTGTERPVTIKFEEYTPDNSAAVPSENIYANVGMLDPVQNAAPPVKSKKEGGGLFSRRRRHRKSKNNQGASAKAEETAAGTSEKEDDKYMVDDEGFTIRPESPGRSEKESFKYSSDSDSEDDDDITRGKINVMIKPKESITPSEDTNNVELLAAITKKLNIGSSPGLRGLPPPESKKNKYNTSPSSSGSERMNSPHTNFAEDFSSTYAVVEPATNSERENGKSDTLKNDASRKSAKERNAPVVKGPAPPIPTEDKDSSVSTLDSDRDKSVLDAEPPPRPPKPNSIDLELSSITGSEQSPRPGKLVGSESWSSLSSVEGSMSAYSNDTGSPSVPSFASFSRGPSPLTLSATDNIPIAVAFIETVHAYFKGGDPSRTLTKVTGEVQISFPAGIVRAFTSTLNPPVLSFNVCCSQANKLQNLTHNKGILKSTSVDAGIYCFNFDMPALIEHLRKLVDKNPHCPHYNIHIISYLVPSSHSTLPLYLSCSWKCEPGLTCFDVDYSYNSSVTSSPLHSVNVIVPVDGSVSSHESTPKASWNQSQNRLTWTIPEISKTSPSGHLKSLMPVLAGPSKPSAFAARFVSEGTILSGADFQLVGHGYRVSLVKKKYTSGKYLCENQEL